MTAWYNRIRARWFGKHDALVRDLRALRAACRCSPNQRSECTVCGPFAS